MILKDLYLPNIICCVVTQFCVQFSSTALGDFLSSLPPPDTLVILIQSLLLQRLGRNIVADFRAILRQINLQISPSKPLPVHSEHTHLPIWDIVSIE